MTRKRRTAKIRMPRPAGRRVKHPIELKQGPYVKFPFRRSNLIDRTVYDGMKKPVSGQAQIKNLKNAIEDLRIQIALGESSVRNVWGALGKTAAEKHKKSTVDPFKRKKESLERQLKKLS